MPDNKYSTPSNNVVIGLGSDSMYRNCVVIGVNIASTEDNQLIIGNDTVTASRNITDDEFNTILNAFSSVIDTSEGRMLNKCSSVGKKYLK